MSTLVEVTVSIEEESYHQMLDKVAEATGQSRDSVPRTAFEHELNQALRWWLYDLWRGAMNLKNASERYYEERPYGRTSTSANTDSGSSPAPGTASS